jgi:hypothetical protein
MGNLSRPEWVVAINRNRWSQSIGTGGPQSIGISGRNQPVRAIAALLDKAREHIAKLEEPKEPKTIDVEPVTATPILPVPKALPAMMRRMVGTRPITQFSVSALFELLLVVVKDESLGKTTEDKKVPRFKTTGEAGIMLPPLIPCVDLPPARVKGWRAGLAFLQLCKAGVAL